MNHWLVCFARDLMDGATQWVATMHEKGKSYTLLSGYGQTQGQLANVREGDVVYVFSHGYHNREHVPTGQIMRDREPINAAALCADLVHQGLPLDRVIDLKVFACFTSDPSTIQSDSFAMILRRAMCKRGYHQLVIHGYPGKTSANVFEGHKSANVPADSPGGEDKIRFRVTRNTPPSKIQELVDAWEYRARDHRLAYWCPAEFARLCPFR